MDMRLRLPELLEERKLTPYRLAKASGGRISTSAAYRLARPTGDEQFVAFEVLAALCDVFELTPNDLLTREDEPPPPAPEPVRQGKRTKRASKATR